MPEYKPKPESLLLERLKSILADLEKEKANRKTNPELTSLFQAPITNIKKSITLLEKKANGKLLAHSSLHDKIIQSSIKRTVNSLDKLHEKLEQSEKEAHPFKDHLRKQITKLIELLNASFGISFKSPKILRSQSLLFSDQVKTHSDSLKQNSNLGNSFESSSRKPKKY